MSDSAPPPEAATSEFSNCPKCGMRVRSTELSVHLAHAHNIATGGGKKDKGKRGNRDRGGRDDRS